MLSLTILITALSGCHVGAVLQHSEAGSEVAYYGRSPPVYPSPIGTGNSSTAWTEAYGRARSLAGQMTLEELANITRGHEGACVGNTGAVPRLAVPSLCLSDAPAGVRGAEFVSAFPASLHLAATWDRDLMYRYGRALGDEYSGKGIHVALGPMAGPMGRTTLAGRNWESLGPDPYLAGVGMEKVTAGIQGAGVVAVAKHWLLNEQEYRRMKTPLGEAVSSNVDDRSLHELYAFPFMDSLRAGAGAVMCSYQRANHSYGCQNSKLLNGILKTELAFEGFVVSDWHGQQSGVASANAGLDLVMPSDGYWGDRLIEALKNGSVPRSRVSDMATRILASWYYLHQDDSFPETSMHSASQRAFPVNVQEDHAALIRTIGAAGTVLVKNVNRTLPFKKPSFLAVYGYDATVAASPWGNPTQYGGGYEVNRGWETFNGTLITGGGSGGTTPPYVVSPFQAIQERISRERGILRWDFWSEDPTPTYVNAEACLVFVNAYASEDFDRESLTDDASDRLVLNVARKCPNTVVVIHSAGTRTVDAWVEHENVTAVLFAGLPGQESGHSIVDVLWGDVNPSAKLPYTVARDERDYGALLSPTLSTEPFPELDFAEGVNIDYRHFDAHNITPRYEFGFGLSYTTFAFADLTVRLADGPTSSSSSSSSSASASASASGFLAPYPDPTIAVVQGGHPSLWDVVAVAHASVTNTGPVAGSEIAQLYVTIAGGDTPARQLRGFARVGDLAPGETRPVAFDVTRRDLSVWDVLAQQWLLRPGIHTIWLGSSSRRLVLQGSLEIN